MYDDSNDLLAVWEEYQRESAKCLGGEKMEFSMDEFISHDPGLPDYAVGIRELVATHGGHISYAYDTQSQTWSVEVECGTSYLSLTGYPPREAEQLIHERLMKQGFRVRETRQQDYPKPPKYDLSEELTEDEKRSLAAEKGVVMRGTRGFLGERDV